MDLHGNNEGKENMYHDGCRVTKEEFAEFVKGIRLSLSMTQEELSREMGVSFVTINKWENGRTPKNLHIKAQIEKLLKIRAEKANIG